jgi:hypothetical protein
MDFIEINENHEDYENIGYVNENGFFENENNHVIGNVVPPNLVDNQSFYQDFSRNNPQNYQQQQHFPKSILKNTARMSTPIQQQPQKKVTYDDILSSLNMKVVNGKLQIIRGDDSQPTPYHQVQRGRGGPPQQTSSKQNDFYKKFLQAQQPPPIPVHVELTPEQIVEQQQNYKRLMMIQYIKSQQQRLRVGQIKSKKMKFV